jgi:hypothetical protein
LQLETGGYAKYNKHDIEQKQNKAALDNLWAGLYGGYIRNIIWQIKAAVHVSYDKYDTARYVANQKASGNFSGYTAGADIEGSLK